MRSRVKKALACLTICLLAGTLLAETRRPNVVIFLVDDLGWSDVARYGSKF